MGRDDVQDAAPRPASGRLADASRTQRRIAIEVGGESHQQGRPGLPVKVVADIEHNLMATSLNIEICPVWHGRVWLARKSNAAGHSMDTRYSKVS